LFNHARRGRGVPARRTQAAILGDWLRKDGRRVTVTHEPAVPARRKRSRAIFLDPAVSLDVAAELLLVLADRAQHVREKLRPAIAAGEIVISDRYSDSNHCLPGLRTAASISSCSAQLNRLASDAMSPDLTIRARLGRRDRPRAHSLRARRHRPRLRPLRGRAAQSSIAKVRDGFLAIRSGRTRPLVVDRRPIAQVTTVTEEIRRAVEELISRRCP